MIVMRIAYVLNATIPTGGATKAFMSMLRGVISLGVTPVVVMPDCGGIFGDLKAMGVECYAFTFRARTYPNFSTFKEKIFFLPRIIARLVVNHLAIHTLIGILRQKNVDLVHTNVGVVNIGYKAAHKLNIPHLYHIREYGDLDFHYHYFPCPHSFYQQLQQSDCFTVCITRDIQRHHGLSSSPLSRVVYDSIRPTEPSYPQVCYGNYFLYAGRVQYTKGLDLLLKAYVLCLKKGVKLLPLWVAGDLLDMNYLGQVQQYIREHDLRDEVTFLGPRSDIEELMAGARALVVPSRYEGFGLCMPEAMFNGCLVIAHDTAGTHEQLENGLRETGEEIALRFQTTEQLAACLEKVSAASRDEFLPMIQRAFSVVNRLYTVEAHAHQIYQYYQDILSL